MDRRTFLLGTGALGLVACSAPERDLLAPYDGVDIELRPGVTTSAGIDAIPDSTTTGVPRSPMEALRDAIEPAEDRVGVSFVARARGSEVTVEENPGDGIPRWTFTNPVASGDDLLFLVEDYDGIEYYQVLLPTRPNGSLGWIRSDSVDLLRHNFAIRVELDEFRLTVFDHEQVVLETTVGVSRDNAPTPRGRYYTTEIIRPARPDSVYGAFAYGLSGFSDTFVTFNGGPGQLGIHGTNDPDSLGTNVSSGCIRMDNDDITRMVEELKVTAGVPVEVL
ncbi:MAG: L,D-transpeptidase [Acidimicrobiales bacterium]